MASKSGIVYLLGSSNELIRRALTLSDGATAIVGKKSGDAFLRILEPDGTLRLLRTFGGSGEDDFFDILETKSKELVLVGFTSSPEFGTVDSSADTWILRLNAHGTQEIWSTIFGAGYDEVLNAVVETDDGSLLAVGSAEFGVRASILFEFDAAGNFTGGQSFNIGPYRSEARDIAKASDGYYVVSGLCSVSAILGENRQMRTYLFKYSDLSKSKLWTRFYGNPRSDYLYSEWFPVDVLKTNTGFLLSTWMQEVNTSSSITQLYFLDDAGAILSSKDISGLNTTHPTGIKSAKDGGFFLLGHSSYSTTFEPNSNTGGEAMMIKFNESGDELWTSYVGNNQLVQRTLAVQEFPEELHVIGVSVDNKLGVSKLMTYKTDTEGRIRFHD